MVLSNKKLKQKLRAAKAELIVTSEAGNKADKIPEGLKTTVPNPIARKPKLSKREILIQEANGEIIEKEEMIDDANEKEENVEVETKMKKRKRDESEALVEKKPKQLKKKKKTKKKKKAKKNVGDGKVNEEGVDQNGRSGAITEQIVAKKVETIVRGEYGHLSLSCPNKKPDLSSSWPKRKQTDEDFTNLEANNEMSSKIRRRSCYECGEKGHLSSACPNINNNKKADLSLSVPEKKQAYDYTEQAYYENPVTSTDASALSAKIRRRSCYECGEKGHLSSACPKILSASLPEKQADVSSSGWPKKQADDYSASAGAVDETGGVSSKIRRRSCYECGEKGHLSSACPKILSASLPEKQADVASSGWPKKQADDYPASAGAVDDTGGVSSKIRRRSCYECGEKGHLSSACPKILSASLPEKQADVAPSYWPEKQADVAPSYRPEKQADDYSANSGAANGSAVSSKIRRRSCYECGEKGHLSSACPKMQQS
ncbi:hypothetical protein MIMGU_mgv1a005349mg [Erythranthe guttata]|uniref:CCHC-type domain-containing protein n=1 Tax=Erythranthe guttata TaxID=4155 RepID=A0A022QP73_ERYGU|nr:hypothetical protein MIMGU_mgv1a005349mg [Erythranthe guttata]